MVVGTDKPAFGLGREPLREGLYALHPSPGAGLSSPSSTKGFFYWALRLRLCGRGLNASAWTKDRYWGKVAVESGRGGEASAPTAHDWRVKRLQRTDL